MNPVALIPIVYFAAVLESSLAMRWEVSGAGPDLLVLAAFSWLMTSTSRYRVAVVAGVGLCSDFNSPAPMGIGMAIFALAGYCAVWMRRRLVLDHFPARLGVIWLAAASITFLEAIALRLFGAGSVALHSLIERSALVGLYTAAIAIPVFMVIGWRSDHRAVRTVLRGG